MERKITSSAVKIGISLVSLSEMAFSGIVGFEGGIFAARDIAEDAVVLLVLHCCLLPRSCSRLLLLIVELLTSSKLFSEIGT